MTSPSKDQLIAAIHAADLRVVLAVTGGGSRAIADLLNVPGASRTLLEADVPYSAAALTAWLGARPESFCAVETARSMAMVAWLRARRYAADDQGSVASTPLAGIACTASLASDRPKRGPHRAHLALQTPRVTASESLVLTKGARSRAEEEHLVAGMLLNLLAGASELPVQLELPLLPGETIEHARTEAPLPWQQLLSGDTSAVLQQGPTTEPEQPPPGAAVYPGAFNPLHRGHRRIVEVGRQRLGRDVQFELSIVNVDKPPLDFAEIAKRCSQFGPDESLWLTRAATFVEKSQLFPGATFLVGVDTLIRIADVHYYGGSERNRDEALETIAGMDCNFLVFGRALEGGKFRGLADLELPPRLRTICQEVPADSFREDISSTELRRAREA